MDVASRVRIGLSISLLLLFVIPSFAAPRVYLVPRAGDGLTRATGYRPKYLAAAGVPIVTATPYGREPVYLVLVDVTNAQHTALTANSDVVALPANLDATVGAQAAAVTSALEGRNIPGQWVTAQTTYRQVLNVVERVFRLAQRLNGDYGVSPFAGGITLSTTMGQLSQQQRDRLRHVAGTFGVNPDKATANMTMRQALKVLADALPKAKGGIVVAVSP